MGFFRFEAGVVFDDGGRLFFFGRPGPRFFLAAADLVRRAGALAMEETPRAAFALAFSEGLITPDLERVTDTIVMAYRCDLVIGNSPNDSNSDNRLQRKAIIAKAKESIKSVPACRLFL